MRENTNEERDFVQALLPLLSEGECLASFTCAGMYRTGYCVIPDDVDPDRLGIAGCLEDTLRRLLDWDRQNRPSEWKALSDRDLVFTVLIASDNWDEDTLPDGRVPLDLGYEMPPLISFARIPLTDSHFERLVHERYKLLWLMENGTTVKDLFEDAEFDTLADRSFDFSRWEAGQIYPGRRTEDSYPEFSEFLQTIYQNAGEIRPCLFYDTERRLWAMDQPDPEGGEDLFPGGRAFPCEHCPERRETNRCDTCFWDRAITKEDSARSGMACYRGQCLFNRLTVCTARCADSCQYRNIKTN